MKTQKQPISLTEQEANDLLSALSFFRTDYPDRKGSVETREDMAKLEAKLWKLVRRFK